MCLCLFAINEHDEYPFILIANRDEFRHRPALPAHFWEDKPTILAGRDLQGNGTWCGINKSGKVAFLTNYRHPKYFDRKGPTRGKLVSDFLSNKVDAGTYIESIENPENYNGFNLVAGTFQFLHFYSNVEQKIIKIDNGIHGLSNALLNTSWPKVEDGKSQLSKAIQENRLDTESLFSILRDENPFDNQKLPDTGISDELEKMLAPKFINSKNYGTVCSTIVRVSRTGCVEFEERSFDENGNQTKTVRFQL